MTTGKRSSEGLAPRVSYRPEQATLIEDVESSSLIPRPPTEKNRALLTLLTGPAQGTIVQLDQRREVTLGRGKRANVLIPDPGLSRVHARVYRRKTPARVDYYVEDCGSTNGTYVAGRRVEGPTTLNDGDRVTLGRRTVLRFCLQDALEEEALIRVHRSALEDRLTGVLNRGAFDDRLHGEVVASRRRGTPIALALFDIDHFKRFNDTYGHQAGDAVLSAVAHSAQQAIREEDVIARYGGEEFAIILRCISPRSASVMAERVRLAIEELSVPWGGASIGVTISLGLVHAAGPATAEPSELIAAADAALYAAKRQGRNRVVEAC